MPASDAASDIDDIREKSLFLSTCCPMIFAAQSVRV
jgi:hypothetical protein